MPICSVLPKAWVRELELLGCALELQVHALPMMSPRGDTHGPS